MPQEKFIAVTYPPLYRAMRSLLIDVLAIVQVKVGHPPKCPELPFHQVTFPAGGGLQTTIINRPDHSQLLRSIWPDATKLASYDAVMIEFKKLEEAGRVAGHWGGNLGSIYAFPIVEKYISG